MSHWQKPKSAGSSESSLALAGQWPWQKPWPLHTEGTRCSRSTALLRSAWSE